MNNGWIGVDLDGTLAYYDTWKGPAHIGVPIPRMLKRVKDWLTEGKDVRIFTARVSLNNPDRLQAKEAIQNWCKANIGCKLLITSEKDYFMTELWDDRCVQLIPNTGIPFQEFPAKMFDKQTDAITEDCMEDVP